MQLTQHSDYALRVLVYLGTRGEDGSATIQEIADAYGISKNHLMKVVNHLARHGYVASRRGKGGGIRLGRTPEEIRIGEVVRATEEDMALVECLRPDGGGLCRIDGACRLKGMLREALGAFLAVLDGYTLADILAPHEALARLLTLPPRAAAAAAGPPAAP